MQSKLELYTREVNRKKDRPNDKELEYITLVVAILHVKRNTFSEDTKLNNLGCPTKDYNWQELQKPKKCNKQ